MSDHLTLERVDLLVYMLRDMADRTKNPLSPRNITVEVLRKSDPDLKSALDRDPKHGAKAWELLGEIYGIRQREESYERGEIGQSSPKDLNIDTDLYLKMVIRGSHTTTFQLSAG